MDNATDTIQDAHNAEHFFASCAFGWATAATRSEALEKLAREYWSQTDIRKQQKKGQPGVYLWSCRVPLPESSSYSIDFYAPKDVGATDGQNWFVTYMARDAIGLYMEPASEKGAGK